MICIPMIIMISHVLAGEFHIFQYHGEDIFCHFQSHFQAKVLPALPRWSPRKHLRDLIMVAQLPCRGKELLNRKTTGVTIEIANTW